MAAPAMTRTISNVPVYHTPEMYPTSPILSFPLPPSASTRLAERTGMSLTIRTSFGAPETTVRSPKNVQPQRNHLPRRRKPKRIRSFQQPLTLNEKEEELREKVPVVEAQPRHVLVINEKSQILNDPFTLVEISEPCLIGVPSHTPDTDSLQEIIPGLCVAFSNAAPGDVRSQHPSGKPWTHAVHISYPAETESHNGSSEQTYTDGVHRLH
ncbi:hypothetical protein EUX98_g9371, partial [Antrodiella citrinella]